LPFSARHEFGAGRLQIKQIEKEALFDRKVLKANILCTNNCPTTVKHCFIVNLPSSGKELAAFIQIKVLVCLSPSLTNMI